MKVMIADSNEIGRMALCLPWEIQKAIVTIQAHCKVLSDMEMTEMARSIVGCISQDLRDMTQQLHDETCPKVNTR